MSLPRIAITQGDPAGVGPETIVAAWREPAVHACCRPLVVGHPELLRRAQKLLGRAVQVQEIAAVDQARPAPDVIPCLTACRDDALDVPPGRIDPRGGSAAYDALRAACALALDRRVGALVTAPLSKAALWQAGHRYPGHTELLAQLCGVASAAMMLYLPGDVLAGATGRPGGADSATGLGVVHVTLHVALRDVLASLTSDEVYAKLLLLAEVLKKLHGGPPRIGVCALNPHAGEEGLFGDEEQRIIAPAVARAAARGLCARGPFPADTLMLRAKLGEFDGVVAMYHDQGHIALKLLGMHEAVNVTLGLPIVRTSVAHGTAFDLAWQGRAEWRGMVAALRVASRLACQ
jgi:4-hydroxythreonine-4-phosphate dehydrogenase